MKERKLAGKVAEELIAIHVKAIMTILKDAYHPWSEIRITSKEAHIVLELIATKEHLKDMRKLIFKDLKETNNA